MTLLKDLIDIPEHIDKGQFVLRLTEGVTDPQATVAAYVPTPQLVLAFDDALNFIKGSVLGHTSKATYLHGSFGSGKSHFMAILHLTLSGNSAARGIPELASVIQKHNSWIEGKKFLLVPYHMIAAHDVESGILGGYVDFVRRVHPDAPIPGVYLAEGLFKDASALRQRMGDDAFFAAMSEGASADSDFGDVDVGWDAARFDSAVDADPGSEERSQLISALVGKFFGSYDTQAGGHGEAFISLDKGLSVISRHAKDLGYDALILFLDELILWLASHAADLKFVHQEGQKLAKLVEAQTADRPIPIVSFIARQRDLSELIGDSVPGADRLNFGDALKHWEGRFHKITLEDRNLPAIAERRVLKCHTPAARQELNAAFEQTAKIRESVMTTLLTGAGDREMFRKVYPFSPALVQTLIAVSSVLQRERTALKVMMQLLVEQRDVLTVGDIVPVGDLFDVIAHGDEAFSQEMAIHFDNAKRLYHQKLLPMLEKTHGRREDLEKLPTDDPRRVGFRNDDRLVKTLLLSALVPEVETLRGLNAERLAALNHGTIKTPIAGREGQEVLRRVRNWAASVGEIRIGEETNPSISIQLSGVDTEGIIKQAEREDNQGNRIRRVRQMLFEQLGVSGEDEFQQHYDFIWKNTSRSCIVLFKNIRELPDASLENDDLYWKLVIDFPFDEAGHGPKDDISRLQQFKSMNPRGAKTICWIPQFFSADALKDLGMLVILEHILTGERFGQYSNHLSPQDRQAAKSLLENQRSVLKTRVQNHLDAAYGLAAITQGSLDTTHELEQHEQFVSLDDGFDPQPPVAANLAGAMNHLLSQALMSEFPGAPNFEAEVKIGNLRKVQTVLSEAAQSQDGRVAVEKTIRSLIRHIANPLQLGEMGHDATHFVLGHHWRNHFNRKAAEASSSISVGQLRKWIDQPRAMGLPKEAQNLVILTYAEQTNRTFVLHNAPVEVSLTNLSNDYVLQEQKLPDEAHWSIAVTRAAQIFGEAVSPLMKATTVANLSAALKKKSSEVRLSCVSFQEKLRDRLSKLGFDPVNSARLTTASATASLVEKLHVSDASQVVSALASAAVATTEAAMGECLSKAAQLVATIDSTNWEIFDAIAKLNDERQAVAQSIRSSITQALQSDEHVTSLGPALKEAQLKAVRLLTLPTPPPPPLPPTPLPPLPSPPLPGVIIVERGDRSDLSVSELESIVEDIKQKYTSGEIVKFHVRWVVEQRGGTP
ncbi:MAG: phage resistance protein [Planctomycetaceae bacterium]|nr:phage resistance protein [Planctomycetaceae bacterium]